MEKQRLLYQQSRLHNRGAAEMVLQMISACKGTSTACTVHHACSLQANPTGQRLSVTVRVFEGYLSWSTHYEDIISTRHLEW